MIKFGETKPHDGGLCPEHLKDDDVVLVHYAAGVWKEMPAKWVSWTRVTLYMEAIKPQVRTVDFLLCADYNDDLFVMRPNGWPVKPHPKRVHYRGHLTGDIDTGELTVKRVKP